LKVPKSEDDSLGGMGGLDPMGGEGMQDPMGGGQDPMGNDMPMGDDGGMGGAEPTDDQSQQAMDLFNKLEGEDKTAALHYLESLVADNQGEPMDSGNEQGMPDMQNDPMGGEGMPPQMGMQESFVKEMNNQVFEPRQGKRSKKTINKEVGRNNPFVSNR
jgi:hypothetical protein